MTCVCQDDADDYVLKVQLASKHNAPDLNTHLCSHSDYSVPWRVKRDCAALERIVDVCWSDVEQRVAVQLVAQATATILERDHAALYTFNVKHFAAVPNLDVQAPYIR